VTTTSLLRELASSSQLYFGLFTYMWLLPIQILSNSLFSSFVFQTPSNLTKPNFCPFHFNFLYMNILIIGRYGWSWIGFLKIQSISNPNSNYIHLTRFGFTQLNLVLDRLNSTSVWAHSTRDGLELTWPDLDLVTAWHEPVPTQLDMGPNRLNQHGSWLTRLDIGPDQHRLSPTRLNIKSGRLGLTWAWTNSVRQRLDIDPGWLGSTWA